jgi:hypothetical protein
VVVTLLVDMHDRGRATTESIAKSHRLIRSRSHTWSPEPARSFTNTDFRTRQLHSRQNAGGSIGHDEAWVVCVATGWQLSK